ncbi:MAG: hypothetical protein R2715_23915 [Ilumatobacteraceae bacterium]
MPTADGATEGGAADDGATAPLDITDAILTATSADCADYDATLTASVTDLTRQVMFESGVTIAAGRPRAR